MRSHQGVQEHSGCRPGPGMSPVCLPLWNTPYRTGPVPWPGTAVSYFRSCLYRPVRQRPCPYHLRPLRNRDIHRRCLTGRFPLSRRYGRGRCRLSLLLYGLPGYRKPKGQQPVRQLPRRMFFSSDPCLMVIEAVSRCMRGYLRLHRGCAR